MDPILQDKPLVIGVTVVVVLLLAIVLYLIMDWIDGGDFKP